MKERIEINQNGEIHYWVQGDHEEVVVFTHGATADHELFRYQVDYFSDQYKVIIWDVPFHGLSRPYKKFSLHNSALELLNILKMEEISRSHFIGQSMGGFITQEIYRIAPQTVRSLCFIGSTPFGKAYLSSIDRWLLRNAARFSNLYSYNQLIREIAKGNTYHRESYRYMLQTLQKLNKKDITDIMNTIYRDYLAYEQKLPISCPLLIAHGEYDRTGKIPQLCRQWAKDQNVSVHTIPKAAHNANFDNPDAFNKLLENFLNRIKADDPV